MYMYLFYMFIDQEDVFTDAVMFKNIRKVVSLPSLLSATISKVCMYSVCLYKENSNENIHAIKSAS